MRCEIHRIPISAPDDVSGLCRLLDAREIVAADVVAVLGKTEGNGCVNDFSRALAVRALERAFGERVGEDAAGRILCIMSGGTEGVLSPHFTVIARSIAGTGAVASVGGRKALCAGVARTPEMGPEHVGRAAHARMTAEAVHAALRDALIEDPSDVHYIQIKCPLLTTGAIAEARGRGHATVTDEPYASMGYSRGASALGAAIALGEVSASSVNDAVIGSRWEHYSGVASASAGSELQHVEVLVLGNSTAATGDLVIAHEVMKDAIDVAAVRRAAARVGWNASDRGTQVVQVFAKAEADPSGIVRERRHTMLTDSDIHHTRHARAVVGGVIASVFGDPMVYVSGGAEHQGPPGGGPVAVVARRRASSADP